MPSCRAVEFRRRRPSPQTLRWVETALGDKARVVAWQRMTGGIISAVHRLTVDAGGPRYSLVLRQYEHARADLADSVERESGILRAVRGHGLAAPELVAESADGAETDGHPSMLMTRLPGGVYLTPADPAGWLGQLARMAVRIHDAPVTAPSFQRWVNADELTIPASASRRQPWRTMIATLQQRAPQSPHRFIHRDFQHFNVLWKRGRLTGTVDWAMASTGPPEIDVGHCRLNLAVLFGADWAEKFRLVYEAETGRAVDPWWDLHALASYTDSWPEFIPIQVAGRAAVDTAGMTGRVEELLSATLNRL
jgi:aminoglycoside phosphotransferase (APT) family kinase protein